MEQNRQIKQLIVMRKDLNMRKGKLVSQGAHASLGCILQLMARIRHSEQDEERLLFLRKGDPIYDWLNGSFTKICVSVDSEDELMNIYNQAKDVGLNACLIEDNGLTEFHGVKTKTCIGIGPDESSKIDLITGSLKLL